MQLIPKYFFMTNIAENPEDRAICEVNGKEYRDGEYFSLENEPDKNCICSPGYKGKFNMKKTWNTLIINSFYSAIK